MADGPAVQQLRNLLGKELRVEVSDGRVITGVFNCIDNDKNLVLRESVEEQVLTLPNLAENNIVKESRVLGIVLVPGRHIVHCGVKKA